MESRTDLSFVRTLIEDRFPDLAMRSLPCGGCVYSRKGRVEPGVHILHSPLPPDGIARLLDLVGRVHTELGAVCKTAYLDLLLQFNGASFFYPYIALYGLQAPREINVSDVGYAPFQLHTPNFYERTPDLPTSELMIGVASEPDVVITVDEQRLIRLRSKTDQKTTLQQFSGYKDFFENILDTRVGSGFAWAKNG